MKNWSIEIRNIVIVETSGTDNVFINTFDLEPPTWPFKEPATLMFHVAKGDAERYVRDNFPNVKDVTVIPYTSEI